MWERVISKGMTKNQCSIPITIATGAYRIGPGRVPLQRPIFPSSDNGMWPRRVPALSMERQKGMISHVGQAINDFCLARTEV